MSRNKPYIFVLVAVLLMGCVRETLYDMPKVEFTVSWENSRDKTHSDAVFYMFAQFDYLTEPMEIPITASKSGTLSLLPGRYKLLMHNAPFAPLSISGTDEFEKITASVDYDANQAAGIAQFMALASNDQMQEIEVRLGGDNRFLFKPISVSRSISFVVHSDDKFGQVDLVNAYIKGVTKQINLSTLKAQAIGDVQISDWKVEGRKFSSTPIEVLGFDDKDKITLLLMVTSPDSEYPKEQPVDLTQEIKNMQGDQIEITLEVEYHPDIRVRKVSIKEWLAGNEINIDIN